MLTKEDLQSIRELLDERLKPIENDIKELKINYTELKKDFVIFKKDNAKLSDNVKIISNTMNLNFKNIETELNKNIIKYFENKNVDKKYKLKQLSFRKLFDPFSDLEITEFDGIFLLEENNKRYLIIVEAKHYVSFENVNKKLNQIYYLLEYLKQAKLYMKNYYNKPNLSEINIKEKDKYTRSFSGTVEQFELHTIDEIMFFIGGPIWQDKVSLYIDDINKGKLEKFKSSNKKNKKKNVDNDQEKEAGVLDYLKKHNIIMIIPKMADYTFINDIEVGGGGGVALNKEFLIPMEILANHIGTKFY